jgi:glutaredoxin-related protein
MPLSTMLQLYLGGHFIGGGKKTKQDWVAQTSIKFKSQLNLKCKLILCKFQVNLRLYLGGHFIGGGKKSLKIPKG